MEKISYGDFTRRLHDHEADRRPIEGTLELTFRCNYRCAHCYVNLPVNDREAAERELTFEEICSQIDAIVEAGCLWLLMTGGEILVRRDFFDIYKYAKNKGLLVTLFTNGALVTEKVADFLAEWRPFSVEITLYGGTKETYDRVTGIPGSYEQCLRGIRLLLERNVPLSLKTVALTLNKREVSVMRELAESWGVPFKYDPLINPRLDCSHKPCQVRLSPEEVVELDLQDPLRAAAFREEFADLGSIPEEKRDNLYTCGAGISNFVISPYGDLEMCMISRHGQHNLREKDFKSGFHQHFPELRSLKRQRPIRCTSCGLRAACSSCPGTAVLESGGDREEPVQWLCDITHLRAAVFGSEALARQKSPRYAGKEALVQIEIPA